MPYCLRYSPHSYSQEYSYFLAQKVLPDTQFYYILAHTTRLSPKILAPAIETSQMSLVSLEMNTRHQ